MIHFHYIYSAKVILSLRKKLSNYENSLLELSTKIVNSSNRI